MDDDGMIDDAAAEDAAAEDGVGGSGYSLEELSAYLDRGRIPSIAAIESNAQCQAVLASMQRFGALSRELVAHESERPLEPGWFDALMREVSYEVRAGRDIPMPSNDPGVHLVITEGAVRELVREAADGVAGVLVGRTALTGDLEAADEVAVQVWVSVLYGRRLAEAAEAVRMEVRTALERHTPLRVGAVDVWVENVHTGEAER